MNEFIGARLREGSTWAGLGNLVGLGAFGLTQGHEQAISAVIVALFNLWQVLRKEK